MGSLKHEIFTLLETDAKLTDGSNLGDLLGLSAAAPYGIYFRNPPTGIDYGTYSTITYFVSSMVGEMPRDIYLLVTAWGDNYEAILNRVKTLLHEINLDTTDYAVLEMKWEWAGPESYDEFSRIYYQQHRFLIKGIPK